MLGGVLLLFGPEGLLAAQDPLTAVDDVREFVGLSPRKVVWFVAQLHLLFAAFVLGVPIFDTTLVVLSRLRRGVNPFTTPGRDHLSHRLADRGRSHLEAVLLLYLAGCFCGLLAMFVAQASVGEAYIVGTTVLAGAACLLRRFEFRSGP